MTDTHEFTSQKLNRAYGEIIELKAEIALMKKQHGVVQPAPTIEIQPNFKITGGKHCVCVKNVHGYCGKPDGKTYCNYCKKELK